MESLHPYSQGGAAPARRTHNKPDHETTKISRQEAEESHNHGEGHKAPLLPGSDNSDQENGGSDKIPSRQPSYWNHLVLDTWFSETLAICFSLVCFIAIVAVLSSYDGKQPPKLTYGLTLNTIVSILATACKSSLLFLVAESIGQLKWAWLYQTGKDEKEHRRPLQDIQLFDGASRGPMGYFTILFGHMRLSLVSLGAVITLLSLAMDPFIQQIIDYPLKEIGRVSDTAAAPRAESFFVGADTEFAPTGIDNLALGAINAGLWADGFDIDPICPSGNCTWAPFDSVGWCSQCEDITPSAVLTGCDKVSLHPDNYTAQRAYCNVTLPYGHPAILPVHMGEISQNYFTTKCEDLRNRRKNDSY